MGSLSVEVTAYHPPSRCIARIHSSRTLIVGPSSSSSCLLDRLVRCRSPRPVLSHGGARKSRRTPVAPHVFAQAYGGPQGRRPSYEHSTKSASGWLSTKHQRGLRRLNDDKDCSSGSNFHVEAMPGGWRENTHASLERFN
eukprot:1181902-Prorocentrum_minimum.AAC.3